MDLATQRLMQAAAGAGGDKIYLDDIYGLATYKGTGGSHSVVNGIDNSTEGGMIWSKARNGDGGGYEWNLVDTHRGAPYYLKMPSQSAQTYDGSNGISSFNTNGYTIHGNSGRSNNTNKEYVSYNFRKCPKFFDIVTYTGNGTSNRQIAHDLDCAVGFMTIFQYQHGNDWVAWHRQCPSLAGRWDTQNKWNSNNFNNYLGSAPSSTHFTVNNNGATNGNGYGYIAYLWAHNKSYGEFGDGRDQDVIKCGGFSANTSGNRIEIDLGFEPQFIMLKKHTTGENPGDDYTYIFDTDRGMHERFRYRLATLDHDEDLSNNRVTDNVYIHATNKGFSLKGFYHSQTTTGWWYVAIRKCDGATGRIPENGTDVFTMDTGSASSNIPTFDAGFPVDWAMVRKPGSTSNNNVVYKALGTYYLETNNSDGKATAAPQSGYSSGDFVFDDDRGFATDFNSSIQAWMWKCNPGFNAFLTNYGNGTASTQTVTHNLGGVPEMIWNKRIDYASGGAGDWIIYHKGFNGGTNPQNYYIKLNSNFANSTGSWAWADTAPTATTLTLGNGEGANYTQSRNLIMCFKSVPGISKVGYYDGNGSSSNAISCGFQPRFLLIKRTDSASDWKYWDSVRGTQFPFAMMLRLNTDNQHYNDALISFTSTGFSLISTDATVNANSGKYVFYAHS